MSGIEILGIAASVLQIADAGARLSAKLFVFTRKIKNADRSLSDISQDIAATGAALRALGEALKEDKYARLGSRDSLATTSDLVADCWRVFEDINVTIGGEKIIRDGTHAGPTTSASGLTARLSKPSFSLKQRLKFPYVEPQIMLLKSKLEGLKSSLMLMLQILMLAEQVRNRPQMIVSEEQKNMIQDLVEESTAKENLFKMSLLALDDDSEKDLRSERPEPRRNPQLSSTRTMAILPERRISSERKSVAQTRTGSRLEDISVTASTQPQTMLNLRRKDIQHHTELIHRLLEEVSSIQYHIDRKIRHRMHKGVLQLHWDEWEPLARKHGHDHFLDICQPLGESHVTRYWLDKLDKDQDRSSPGGPAYAAAAASNNCDTENFVNSFRRVQRHNSQLQHSSDTPESASDFELSAIPEQSFEQPLSPGVQPHPTTSDFVLAPSDSTTPGEARGEYTYVERMEQKLRRLQETREGATDSPKANAETARLQQFPAEGLIQFTKVLDDEDYLKIELSDKDSLERLRARAERQEKLLVQEQRKKRPGFFAESPFRNASCGSAHHASKRPRWQIDSNAVTRKGPHVDPCHEDITGLSQCTPSAVGSLPQRSRTPSPSPTFTPKIGDVLLCAEPEIQDPRITDSVTPSLLASHPQATSTNPWEISDLTAASDLPAAAAAATVTKTPPPSPHNLHALLNLYTTLTPTEIHHAIEKPLSTRSPSGFPSPSPSAHPNITSDAPRHHYYRANYCYTAAIPEEISFKKGDVLDIVRKQEDGWWEAVVLLHKGPSMNKEESKGKEGRKGLVPSNYLVPYSTISDSSG